MLVHFSSSTLFLGFLFFHLLFQCNDARYVHRHAGPARSLASRHHRITERDTSRYLADLDANKTRDEADYIMNWMPKASCFVENAMNGFKEKYSVTLINFDDTGYCGKGLADNLHEECEVKDLDGWGCNKYKSGSANGPDEFVTEFYFPRVVKYRCVENAIAKAGNQRAPWIDCTGDQHDILETVIKAVEIGSLGLLPLGWAGSLVKVSVATAKAVANALNAAGKGVKPADDVAAGAGNVGKGAGGAGNAGGDAAKGAPKPPDPPPPAAPAPAAPAAQAAKQPPKGGKLPDRPASAPPPPAAPAPAAPAAQAAKQPPKGGKLPDRPAAAPGAGKPASNGAQGGSKPMQPAPPAGRLSPQEFQARVDDARAKILENLQWKLKELPPLPKSQAQQIADNITKAVQELVDTMKGLYAKYTGQALLSRLKDTADVLRGKINQWFLKKVNNVDVPPDPVRDAQLADMLKRLEALSS